MKVLLVGIDGGELSVIRKGIEKGILPTFKRMMRNGIYGELTSTIPPGTAPAWVSMVTGVNPGKHGIFDFVDWKTGKLLSSSDVKSPTIWEIIDKSDMKSVIINVPFTYPPDKIDGVIIPGIPLPLGRKSTYPNYVESFLNEKGYVFDFGEYDALKYILMKKEYSLLNHIREITEKRTAVALKMMRSIDWNFFMVVYTALDRIQHVAFHNAEVILDAYKIVDENIQKLLDSIDQETAVLVVSDHGFERARKVLYINEFLRRAGLVRFISKKSLIMLMSYQHMLHLLSRKGPSKILIGKVLEKMDSDGKLMNSMLKLSRGEGSVVKQEAKVLSTYGRYSYLSVKNEETKAKLAFIFKNLKNPRSNDNIIEEIIPSHKLYNGNSVSKAPEFVLKHRPAYVVFTLVPTPKVVIDITMSPEPRTGRHKLQGILVVYSKKLLKQNTRVINASIYDVAPTVLALLGLSIPYWMDGKLEANLLEAFGQKDLGLLTDEKQKILYKLKRFGL